MRRVYDIPERNQRKRVIIMGKAINGIQVTATATELNLIDGVTATTTELNYLDVATLGTQEASKAVTTDSNVNSGAAKNTSMSLGTSGSEVLQQAELLAPTDLTQVDDTALLTVGRLYTDTNGDVYIYLKGVVNVLTGWVVSFIVTTTGLSTTAEIVTTAVGHVGVAMGAIVAGKFGWFQVAGLNLVCKCDTSAAIGQAYIGGTTGGVDDNAISGDLIHGMQIVVADSSNVCGVYLTYPSVTAVSGVF